MVVAPHLISARGGHGRLQRNGGRRISRMLQATGIGGSRRRRRDPHPCSPGNPSRRRLDQVRRHRRLRLTVGRPRARDLQPGGDGRPSRDGQRPQTVPVTPHSYGDEGIQRAVRAGVRSIEHGNLASAETLQIMQDAGVFMVPTQYTILSGARRAENDPLWAALPEHSRRKMEKYRGPLLDAAEGLAASDVRIAFGTDAGMFPHQDNWREFPMMVSTGITPLRALRRPPAWPPNSCASTISA